LAKKSLRVQSTKLQGMRKLKSSLRPWLIAAGWVYYAILFGWYAAYVISGDQFGYLGLLNALSFYLFAPLPVMALLAMWTKRREQRLGFARSIGLFLWLWGGLLIPPSARAHAEGETLTVMSYNVLGLHTQTEPIIETLLEQDVDLVLLQEVNEPLSEALATAFAEIYPYQIVDPVNDVRGMAALSKYPLQASGEQLPLEWLGRPQLLELVWNDQVVKVLNVHLYSTGFGLPWAVSHNFRLREQQAHALADYASQAAHNSAVIVAVDANATSMNTAFQILTESMTDAWLSGGFGFGHTFPGSADSGTKKPRVAGMLIPRWLIRIDYIFLSEHWDTRVTWNAPHDGVSDHRAVVAELSLR